MLDVAALDDAEALAVGAFDDAAAGAASNAGAVDRVEAMASAGVTGSIAAVTGMTRALDAVVGGGEGALGALSGAVVKAEAAGAGAVGCDGGWAGAICGAEAAG